VKTRTQFFVELDGDQWAVRATDGRNSVTVRRYAAQDDAVGMAAAANARTLELAPPAAKTKTVGQHMAALRREMGVAPIVGKDGRPYAVHHRNQHTD